MMKTKTLIPKIMIGVSVLAVLFLTGFAVNSDTNRKPDLTKNVQLRNEVFQQIMNNRLLLNEFMNRMMQNHQSMDWMMGNSNMMQYMFSGNHLGYMMHRNPGMNRFMMQGMMQTIRSDSAYCRQWNTMMEHNHHGMQMQGGMMMMNQ